MFSWADKARNQQSPSAAATSTKCTHNVHNDGDDLLSLSPTSMLLPPPAESGENAGVSIVGDEQQQQRVVRINETSHIVPAGMGYVKSTVRKITGDMWASRILVYAEYTDVLRVGLCCHTLYDAARRESLWITLEDSYLRQYCVLTGREEPPQPTFLLPPQCSSLILSLNGDESRDRDPRDPTTNGGRGRRGSSTSSGGGASSTGARTPVSSAASRSAQNTPKVGPSSPSGAGGGGGLTGYVVRGDYSTNTDGGDTTTPSPPPHSSPPIAPRGCTVDRALARDSRILNFIRLARFLVGDLQRQWHLQTLAQESWLFKRVAKVVTAFRRHAGGRGNALLRTRGYVPVEFEPFLGDVVVADLNKLRRDEEDGGTATVPLATRAPIQQPSRRDAATERRQLADVQRRVEEAEAVDAERREDEELAGNNGGTTSASNVPLFYTATTTTTTATSPDGHYDVYNDDGQGYYDDEEDEGVEEDEQLVQQPAGVSPIPVHIYTILRPDDAARVPPATLHSLLDSLRNGVPSRLEYFETTEANPTMYMSTLSQVLRRLHGGGLTALGVRGSLNGPRFATSAHLVEITQDEAIQVVADTFLNLDTGASTYNMNADMQNAETNRVARAAAAAGGRGGMQRQYTNYNNNRGGGGGGTKDSYEDPNSLKTMARLLVTKELTVDTAETRYFVSPQITSSANGMGLVVVDPLLVSVFYP